MTIVDTTLMWSQETGSTESNDGKEFTKKFSTAYQVVHTAEETQAAIEAAPGIAVGDLLDGYVNVYCVSLSTSKSGPVLSVVQVNYEGKVSFGGDDATDQDPDIDYYALVSDAEIDEDADGLPICTTIGEPVHGIKKPVTDMVLRVKRNYLAISGITALAYMDSINSDVFVVEGDAWQPGQAAMTNFKIKPVRQQGITQYYEVECEITLRQPYNTVASRAWWARYRNEGMYAMYGTTVTFSGGGGTGAAGYAIASSGAVTNVVITSRGRDYTSAPAVAFSSTTGGTGATGTAVLGAGAYADEVVSVTVTNGGTDYKSGRERAVDKNKEPVTKPVLLAVNGTQLVNTDSAFWIQRRVKSNSLNYTALGLLL